MEIMETIEQAEMTSKKKDKGFTLIELLVVVAILATLATVVVVAVRGIKDKSDYSACKTDYVALETALETYAADVEFGVAKINGTVAYDTSVTPALMATTSAARFDALVKKELIRRPSKLYTLESFDDIDPVAGTSASPGQCVGQYDQSEATPIDAIP
jgi:prepilin-type N-terminal cleavage/methylation domain-containing protein